MAKYVRANAWNNGGTFTNPDLHWYAIGVGAMQARPLDDPLSWWFFAAIHGQYVTPAALEEPGVFPWSAIPGPPAVPSAPLPAEPVYAQYWDQCQHQSWFFPPWHRGYLLALEAQVRSEIVQRNGPADWALPYWNYLGPGAEFNIPPAFAAPAMPNGDPNPLYVLARYGPDMDSHVYVPTPRAIQLHPNDPNFIRGPVVDTCMTNDLYTGSNPNTNPPGFGGPETEFWHGGGRSGNLESNPHNSVHVYVGRNSADGQIPGLMSDPGLAALDPIFYLHHANIDRMWGVWNSNPANENPIDPNWLNGPGATGDREFAMPRPDGSAWIFAPRDVGDLAQLDYTYDNLPAAPPAPNLLSARLARLGATEAAVQMAAQLEGAGTLPQEDEDNAELLGASEEAIPILGAGGHGTVRLDADVREKVSQSLTEAVTAAAPDRVFLNLENVRGTRDAFVLSVYVNLADDARPGDHPELLAGTVSLFGLRGASWKDGKHGGGGLSFVLDITQIVDTLFLNNQFNANSLRVRIVPDAAVPPEAQITIGRISVYRQGS